MKTAIITGASSGLGRQIALELDKVFPEITCYWLIARRRERLEKVARHINIKNKDKIIKCFPLDLCDPESLKVYQEHLEAEQPEVMLLVNDAGCGYLGNLDETNADIQTHMVDLNIRALTALTSLTLPFMRRGSKILNIASIAAFCPTPRMTVYSATKAYVYAFTVGIAEELKEKGITATAVCPAPMATGFLAAGGIAGHSHIFARLPYCDQVHVAISSLCAARKGQVIYTPKLYYKFYRFLAKITPVKYMAKFTKT